MSGFQFMVKPGFGKVPFLFDYLWRDIQQFCDFFQGSTSEEAHFNNAALQRVEFFQFFECFVYRQDFLRLASCEKLCFLQQYSLLVASALLRALGRMRLG